MGARIFVNQSFGPIDLNVMPPIGIERDIDRTLFLMIKEKIGYAMSKK
jgi:hypothetical protein